MEWQCCRFRRRELKPVFGQAAGFNDPVAFVVLGTCAVPKPPRQRLCLWTPFLARAANSLPVAHYTETPGLAKCRAYGIVLR
jgi:hypothetical protein